MKFHSSFENAHLNLKFFEIHMTFMIENIKLLGLSDDGLKKTSLYLFFMRMMYFQLGV